MIQPHRAAKPREVVESPAIGDQVRARCLDGGLCLGEVVAVDPLIVREPDGMEHLCCDGQDVPEHGPRAAA